MANVYPYISDTGKIAKIVEKLREHFPAKVDIDILKKLQIAPGNEISLINILRFIGVLGEEGQTTEKAERVFTIDSNKFASELGKMVKTAYKPLFVLHKSNTWKLDQDDLIDFFQSNNKTSKIIGKHQAKTFQVLAEISGFRDLSDSVPKKAVPKKAAPKKAVPKKTQDNNIKRDNISDNVSLTVRIEVNLPSDGTQETYDRIFKSIRENFLNG